MAEYSKLLLHLLGAHNLHIVFVTDAGVHPRLLHAEHGELNPHTLASRDLQHGSNWFMRVTTTPMHEGIHLYNVEMKADKLRCIQTSHW